MNSDNFSKQVDLASSPYIIAPSLETNLPKPFQLKTSQSKNIFGIDTLKIGFNIYLSASQLDGWLEIKRSLVHEIGGEPISKIYTRKHRMDSGGEIHFTYIPVDYKDDVVNLLLIEFTSVPKLLGICSHSQISDLEKAWDVTNGILSGVPFLVKIPNVRDGIIYRVDLSANLQVGKNVHYFLDILCQRYFPHRCIQTFPGKQVIWSAKEISLSFYDKYKLCKTHKKCNYGDAAGILRMEIQMRTKRETQKWLESKEPTLRMVTTEKMIARLEKDFCILKLDKPIAGNLIERISISNDLSKTEIKNLVSYVTFRDTKSREELRKLYTQ